MARRSATTLVLSIWPVVGSGPSPWSWHQARFAMAPHCGHGPDAEALIERVLVATDRVVNEVGARLPAGFSARVFETVTQGLRRSVERLQRMPVG